MRIQLPLPDQSTARLNCTPIKINENLWECLAEKRCKYSLCYGGDAFCKHPRLNLEGTSAADFSNP